MIVTNNPSPFFVGHAVLKCVFRVKSAPFVFGNLSYHCGFIICLNCSVDYRDVKIYRISL